MSELFRRPATRLMPWPEVRALTGLSRTTVWRLQQTGEFPSPVPLSPGRVGWVEAEVDAWREARLDNEPRSGDRFERRAGGRPPAWVAGGRPSRRKPKTPQVDETPATGSDDRAPVPERPDAVIAPSSPKGRRGRGATRAAGQLDFGF